MEQMKEVMNGLRPCVEKLYYWQYSRTNCFSDLLFDLFQKADPGNYQRLAKGFPEHAMALNMWNTSGDSGKDLFRAFDLLKD